jgi:hypothetical protein
MRCAVGLRYAAAVPLVLAMLVTGCGGYKSKYTTATADLTAAQAKNKELQDQVTAANAKSADLEQKVAAMQTSVDQLNAEVEKQKQATTEATTAYEGMVNQLKGELSSGQVTIQQMRDGIRVNLAQDILFKSGSADLGKEGQDLLAKVAGRAQAEQVRSHRDRPHRQSEDWRQAGGEVSEQLGARWCPRREHRQRVREVRDRAGASADGVGFRVPSACRQRHARGSRSEPAHRDPGFARSRSTAPRPTLQASRRSLRNTAATSRCGGWPQVFGVMRTVRPASFSPINRLDPTPAARQRGHRWRHVDFSAVAERQGLHVVRVAVVDLETRDLTGADSHRLEVEVDQHAGPLVLPTSCAQSTPAVSAGAATSTYGCTV